VPPRRPEAGQGVHRVPPAEDGLAEDVEDRRLVRQGDEPPGGRGSGVVHGVTRTPHVSTATSSLPPPAYPPRARRRSSRTRSGGSGTSPWRAPRSHVAAAPG